RTKLVLIGSSFVVLTSFFISFYVINLQKNLFVESFSRTADNSFQTVRVGMEEILSLESYETLGKIFTIAKNEKYFDFIVITNQFNEIVATYPDSLRISLNELSRKAKYSSPQDSTYLLSSSYKSKFMSGVLFIGYSTKEIREYEKKALIDVSVISFIVLIVLITVILFVVGGITTPLEKLKHASDRIRSGDFTSRAGENKGGIEVSSVSKAFNLMVDKLTSTQKELQKEISEAGMFVASILPEPINDIVKVEWRFTPTRELGGDAFGYHYLDESTLAIYLLDASGHGVGSALLSVSAINILRTQSLLNTDFYNPSSVLSSLNNVFQMERNADKYFTMWYGVLNLKTNEILFSSAGHPPAILIRANSAGANELFQLGVKNNFIGFLPNVEFSHSTFQLKANDSLYIYSDGLFEIIKQDGKILSQAEFTNIISSSNSLDLDEILLKLRKQHVNDMFSDDCALLRIKIK
ncbi:MAG: PP2C family protein-serine/threonine phosphatase, partial [Ignavibacteria bacterium]|nr:PP2C family protein-serine/threonine phosphatase [Ignavibacteria bacterium]